MAYRRSCVICGHSNTACTAKGLHFHCAPRRTSVRSILDKWLEFLKLKPSREWKNEEWRDITLCSLHFNEDVYSTNSETLAYFRLAPNAVPTRNPPENIMPLKMVQFRQYFKDGCLCKPNPKLPNENSFMTTNLTSVQEPDGPLVRSTTPKNDDVPVNSTSNASCKRDSVNSSNFNQHNAFPLSTTNFNDSKEQELDVPVIDASYVRSKDTVKSFNCDNFNDFLPSPRNISDAKEQEMVLVLSDVTLSGMSSTIHRRETDKSLNFYNFFDFPSTPTNINNSLGHEMDNEDTMVDSVEQDLNSLECVKHELCRVCGKNTSSLLPILDKSESDLVKLLEMYLPLKIAENDTYPMNICLQCHDSLHKWHELYVTCLAADKAFKTTFDSKTSQDPKDVAKNRTCAEEEASISSNVITEGEDVVVSYGDKEQSVIHENDVPENTSDEFLNDVPEIFKTDMFMYKCKFCNEQFKNLRDMNVHYRLCRLDPTICEICGKTISHQKQLFKHRLKYHNRRTFPCEKCGENINIHSLIYHMETVHSLSHFCDLCCKSLHSNPVYKLHMKRHRMGNKKSTFKLVPVSQNGKCIYVCPVCGQIFNNKSTILTHLTKPCSVTCSACAKNLKNEKQLILHSCEKWKCQFCSKTFLHKQKWCEHERIHTGEKPYKCHYCDTTFRRIRQRSVHHKTHCVVSFECQFCYKKFRFLQLLRSHIRTHDHKHS